MPFRNKKVLTATNISDLTATAAELNVLDVSGMTLGDVLRATDATTLAAGDVEHAKATALTGTFSGFTSAETKDLNITSVPSENPVTRRVQLYVSNDPTGDENINCRLSFYSSDSMTEDELLAEFYFNLTYTETNGGASASDTTDTVDDISGLVKYDLIRYTGGTAENVRLTATPSGTTLTFTALVNAHADDTGIVRVVELDEMFQLVDDDASAEIHCRLETLSAPNASMNVAISVEVQ